MNPFETLRFDVNSGTVQLLTTRVQFYPVAYVDEHHISCESIVTAQCIKRRNISKSPIL